MRDPILWRIALASAGGARHGAAEVKSTNRRRESHNLGVREDQFVLAAGKIVHFAPEIASDPTKIDHFWITLHAGGHGRLQVSINTWSLRHAAAGFDPRLRVGTIRSNWSQLPVAGISAAPALDYAQLEKTSPVVYREMERPALEELLMAKAGRAILVESWGAFYRRAGIGIHQVHCRRASSSVPTDLIGRDGAVRFYFREESRTEMLLFKYFGQP